MNRRAFFRSIPAAPVAIAASATAAVTAPAKAIEPIAIEPVYGGQLVSIDWMNKAHADIMNAVNALIARDNAK